MPSDFILVLDGIKGESTDKKLEGNIDISSFSWGLSNAGTHAVGTGGGKAKASFQDIHFTAPTSKASPNLAQACANGKHIKKAVLHVRKAGEQQQEYYTLTLEDLLVSSYQSGDSSGGGDATDQFALNFAKVKYEYCSQKKDGTLDPPVTMTWDLQKNSV
ncbi:MAG: Hcp1 family type VI secretion system effector [Bosea sp. 12-68-7]|nr:MAG: Hcp1 family type VI secretion system effector [Bosea sp. 12-68-7]OYW99027.1 MAG: Hcp1 family type VI secretion system effector [Bosea sp. 32-68-6]